MESRHSVRAFKPIPVSKEVLMGILNAANRAPSWADTQPWEIFVAGGETLNRLRQAFTARCEQGVPVATELARPTDWPAAPKKRMMDFVSHSCAIMGVAVGDERAREASVRRNFEFFGAPVVVYLCLDKTLTPWSYFDLGLVAQNIMLAAKELEIDSVIAVNLVGYPELIREELDISDDLMIVIGIALGYEDVDNIVNKSRSPRRPIEEVVRTKGL